MRYFLGFLATIGLIIFIIILLFHGGGKPKSPIITRRALDTFATTDATVSMTAQGPINANVNHEQIRIIVSANDATFQHIRGYQGTVVDSRNYANNVDSYTNFLFALERAGFTNGNNSKVLADYRGYCPLGTRYIFDVDQGGQNIQQYWATNCGGTRTYLGELSLTLQLFQNQIPDYSLLTQNIAL
jgi:hypothetical protein